MPNTYKILGQVNPSANTQSNIEVVPAATEVVINSIQISNQSASNARQSLWRRSAAPAPVPGLLRAFCHGDECRPTGAQ